jgi:tripartite-type tricarboxylate transporter receptor subunit TctC
MLRGTSLILASMVVGAVALGVQNARAQVPARSGTAAPITLAIGSAAGGGSDQYGRLLARHLPRFLPGSPLIIAKNMNGASGILVLNWTYTSAPRDGTAIANPTGSSVMAPLQGMAGAQYDPRQFHWLYSIGNLTNMLVVWHASAFHTLDDVMTKPLVLGNGSGDTATIPAMINRLGGTKFKIISGYPGTNAVSLAMERGEVDGTMNLEWGTLQAVRADWMREKKIRIPLQVTFHPVAGLPGVPSLNDIITKPDDRAMMEILMAKQDVGRPYITPPGVAPEIVASQRAAFERVAADSEFLADAAKMNLLVEPTSGADLEALVAKIYATPQAIVDRLQAEMKIAEKEILKK